MRSLLNGLVGSAAAIVVMSSAHAADLPTRIAAPAPVTYAAPVFTWTGFYAGVNAGYGWGTGGNSSANDATAGYYTGSNGGSGFMGGAQVGYNYQLIPGYGIVLGVEADLQYAGLSNDETTNSAIAGTYTSSSTPRLDYFGTVRGRVGYVFDRVLIYGTAGLAYGGGSSNNAYYSSLTTTSNFDSSGFGYTVGAGAEYAITPNITAKIEGLYVNIDRGSSSAYDAAGAVYDTSGRNEFGVVRAGLNYRF